MNDEHEEDLKRQAEELTADGVPKIKICSNAIEVLKEFSDLALDKLPPPESKSASGVTSILSCIMQLVRHIEECDGRIMTLDERFYVSHLAFDLGRMYVAQPELIVEFKRGLIERYGAFTAQEILDNESRSPDRVSSNEEVTSALMNMLRSIGMDVTILDLRKKNKDEEDKKED